MTHKEKALCWVLPLQDGETKGEDLLARAEVEAAFSSIVTDGSLPIGLHNRLIISRTSETQQFDALLSIDIARAPCAFEVQANAAEVASFAYRTAYTNLLLWAGDSHLAISDLQTQTLLWQGGAFQVVLPTQRILEASAVDKSAVDQPDYVKALVAYAWNRSVLNLYRDKDFNSSPASRKKNEYLAHAFHKYKAKFFPRLARSLINITAGGSTSCVLDPMAGSGTTCVEAGLMGLPCMGFDIDPLSSLISNVKSHAFDRRQAVLADLISHLNSPGRADRKQLDLFSEQVEREPLPRFIASKIPQDTVERIESDYARISSIVDATTQGIEHQLARLALSHAISTKISLRWMGTGDNRFALEIASSELPNIYVRHLKMISQRLNVFDRLVSAGIIHEPPTSLIARADARHIPLPCNTVSSIVTSPPYLPAASGRETYLRSRAPAIVMLGLLTEEDVLETEKRMLGSILVPNIDTTDPVPPTVQSLVDWMLPQRARSPKAGPTRRYFESLKVILREMHRVLEPGGMCGLVVSSRHMFYEMVTRDIVQSFDMASAIVELATQPEYQVNLEPINSIEIELPKMDFVQRPASRHAYSESIILLRKPSG